MVEEPTIKLIENLIKISKLYLPISQENNGFD